MNIESLLIIEDDPLMRQFLQNALAEKGYTLFIAEEGEKGRALLKQHPVDLILCDMKMPGLCGIDLLRALKEQAPQALILVMTAYGTIESAVEAMRLGAFHYLLKPFSLDVLEMHLERAAQHLALLQENLFLKAEIHADRVPAQVIADSPPMQKILEEAKKVAKSHASVLIHGESGTGKEVIASTIHAHSLRAQRPYIRVNCAAIPDTLIESEFFGHEKGAFTGAAHKRLGRFELANMGTLLLDEVTEIPLPLQPKLLRVIQEKEFERVGGGKAISVDVRLISTTNRNLKEAMTQKIFREDLFYRLNVVPLYLPPLRERKEDILPLCQYFLQRFCQQNRKAAKKLSKEAETKLLAYPWPGNIRELANVIERVVVLDYGTCITPAHLALE